MRRFAFYMNIFSIIFLFFEPVDLHSTASKSLPSNGGSEDTEPYTARNPSQKQINNFIKEIFAENGAGTPKAMALKIPSPIPNPSPKSISTQNSTRSSVLKWIVDDNVTDSYYSTHVENYPDHAEIAQKLEKFRGFYLKDVLPKPEIATHTLIDADKAQYRDLCRSKTELIKPREIENAAKEKVKVVNYNGDFEQIIRSETCWAKDSPCEYGDMFPSHLKPICKQNYIFRTILTMDENNEPHLEEIPVPASCICVLKDMSLR